MPLRNIKCPYCDTINPLATVKTIHQDKLISEIMEIGDSVSSEILNYHLKCVLCRQEYEYIELSEFSWIKNHLELSDTMITTFKNKFQNVNFDSIYTNIKGITRPKNKIFRRNHLHICFEIEGERMYIDCHQKKDKLKGLNIFEV